MSLLDKFNDPASESEKTDDLYKNQYEELENQLNSANEINKRNVDELHELKILLSEYTKYADNLKQSYLNSIENLKSQLKYEKEINEKYLQKIVESNKDLNNDIKTLNDKSEDNIKELSVLFLLSHSSVSPFTSGLSKLLIWQSTFIDKAVLNKFQKVSFSKYLCNSFLLLRNHVYLYKDLNFSLYELSK